MKTVSAPSDLPAAAETVAELIIYLGAEPFAALALASAMLAGFAWVMADGFTTPRPRRPRRPRPSRR